MKKKNYILKDPHTRRLIMVSAFVIVFVAIIWKINQATGGYIYKHFNFRKNTAMFIYNILKKLHLAFIMPLLVWFFAYMAIKEMIERYKEYKKICKIFTFFNVFAVFGGIIFLILLLFLTDEFLEVFLY
jgi:hypothetical protein